MHFKKCTVTRAVRIEYGGAFYHVMARANRRERIFRNEADRLLFYQTLGEACERLEGDCQQAGHAQRCKREPTSPPVPCPEIQVTTRFKRISPVCQDFLTDPQCTMPNAQCATPNAPQKTSRRRL